MSDAYFVKRLFIAPRKGFSFEQPEWERAWAFIDKDPDGLFKAIWRNNSLYFQVRPEAASMVLEFSKHHDDETKFGEVFKVLELSTIVKPAETTA